jgi:hypothetical protein
VIVPIVNQLPPVPVFRLHVVAPLPFVMASVLVMVIVMMILGNRHSADKAGRYVVTARIL